MSNGLLIGLDYMAIRKSSVNPARSSPVVGVDIAARYCYDGQVRCHCKAKTQRAPTWS